MRNKNNGSMPRATLLFVVLCGVHIAHANKDDGLRCNHKSSVVIVGAGLSGLMAAKQLSESGISDFVIVEALPQIGGRMRQGRFGDIFVEKGANWAQPGSPANPIVQLVRAANLTGDRSDYRNCSVYMGGKGRLYDSIQSIPWAAQFDAVAEAAHKDGLRRLKEGLPDMSTRVAFARQGWDGGAANSKEDALRKAYEWYNHDFEWADPPEVNSLEGAWTHLSRSELDPTDAYQDFFVQDQRGVRHMAVYIASSFLARGTGDTEFDDPRLFLNTPINEISHTDAGVAVATADGETFCGDYALVTVSVGVLKSDQITWSPALPEWKLDAIFRFDMALYMKIFLKFETKFWRDGEQFFLNADSRRGYYTLWQDVNWNGNLGEGLNALMVTLTSSEAQRAETLTDEQIIEEAVGVLQSLFMDVDVPRPTAWMIPRWLADPYARGSYSNWPLGMSQEQHEQLKAPLGRVHFAGEHMERKHFGYMQGAYYTGVKQGNALAALITSA
eukprot:Opistho-2@6352